MLQLSHSDRDAMIRSGQAHKCRACRGAGTVYCPGGETRCPHCHGMGILPECPVCEGREHVEVYDTHRRRFETVACECVEPIAA